MESISIPLSDRQVGEEYNLLDMIVKAVATPVHASCCACSLAVTGMVHQNVVVVKIEVVLK